MQTTQLGALLALSIAALPGAALADAYTFSNIAAPTNEAIDASFAYGINDSGQVVGTVQISQGRLEAFIVDASSGAGITFYNPSFFTTSGYGINNLNQVVGNGSTDFGGVGYVRDAATRAFNVFPQPSYSPGSNGGNAAFGINDAGQVVGIAISSSRAAPYGSTISGLLYDPTTGSTSLFSDSAIRTDVSNGYTVFNDINNRGQIVGSITPISKTGSGLTTGFLLDLATNTYTIIAVPGATSTSANGINDKGQVVGSYSFGSTTASFVLDVSTNQYSTLAELGSTSTIASGINDLGQIVGGYTDSADVQRAFLAAPSAVGAAVPEPASLALLGGVLCIFAPVRWSRARGPSQHDVSRAPAQ